MKDANRKYELEFNQDNPAAHLLTKEDETNISYYVRGLRKDLEEWNFKHAMWSKYYDSFWFQRATGFTKEYMLNEFYRLAELIDFYQPELDAYERILFLHRTAIEILHNDMNYLKKVNLSITELNQQTLFT